LFVSTVGHFLT